MGTFDLPTPMDLVETHPMFVISKVANDYKGSRISFKTKYFNGLWTLPNLDDKSNGFMGMASPLFVEKVSYQSIQMTTSNVDQDIPLMEQIDHFTFPIWALSLSNVKDPMDLVLPYDKYMTHRSYFLPDLYAMETKE